MIAASKITVKNTKIEALRTINIKFIEEQRQLLEQYQQKLANYNKTIGAAPSGVAAAAAASGAAGPPKKSLPSIPAPAASKGASKGAAAASVKVSKSPKPAAPVAAAASDWSSD